MKRIIALLFCASLLLIAAAAFAAGPATLEDCGKILKAMKIDYQKKGADRLVFKTGFGDEKKRNLICMADPKNKVVYLAVLDMAKLKKDDQTTCALSKKLLALNFGLMMTKLEWDEKKGEVRLSLTLDTDTGLAPKRFADALVTLLLAAEQVEGKLK